MGDMLKKKKKKLCKKNEFKEATKEEDYSRRVT